MEDPDRELCGDSVRGGNRELSFDAGHGESCYSAGDAEVELAVIDWLSWRI